MRTPKEGQIYEHFKKGNLYQIITVAEDVDTVELYVVYKQIPKNDDQEVDDKHWIRLLKDFNADVEVAGKKVPRFKRVENG